MKKLMIAVSLAAFLFAGCLVASDRRGHGVVVVPALPTIVILEDDPYYFHGGYHYHYRGDVWYYSKSRGGPWVELPRDRYPKETRFKGRGKGDERGRGEKRGHDKKDGY